MKKFTKSKVWDYVFLHLIIFQMSIGGIFSKTAASKEFLSFEFFLFYGLMILNLGVYAILWQQVLKRIPLTTAFCNKAVSIVWGVMWGMLFFNEVLTWNMIVGGIIVLLGVCLVVISNE